MRVADERDAAMVRNPNRWPGGRLCLKKRPTNGETATGVMGYSMYGVITSDKENPVTIHLRGDVGEEDFKTTKQYATFDEMFNDGWMVD